MRYKLRLVQKFSEGNREDFVRLEREFAQLEKDDVRYPRGKRYTPITGRDGKNTLIWEAEFGTLEEVFAAMNFMSGDPKHEALYAVQSKYFLESYMEILETLE